MNGDKRLMEEQPLIVSHFILDMPEAKKRRFVIVINEDPRFVIGRSPMINPKLVEDDGVWEAKGPRSREDTASAQDRPEHLHAACCGKARHHT